MGNSWMNNRSQLQAEINLDSCCSWRFQRWSSHFPCRTSMTQEFSKWLVTGFTWCVWNTPLKPNMKPVKIFMKSHSWISILGVFTVDLPWATGLWLSPSQNKTTFFREQQSQLINSSLVRILPKNVIRIFLRGPHRRIASRESWRKIFVVRVIKLPGGIKHKFVVILRNFPYNNALFGLASYNDPCRSG